MWLYSVKIGIDVRSFVFDQGKMTGIGKYIYEVIKVWMREYPEEEYYLLANDEIPLELQLSGNWHIVTDTGLFRNSKLWGMVRLPYHIKRLGLDVFWGPNFVLPHKVVGTKYFVSIYDLAAWRFPDTIERSNAVRLHLRAKRACKRADGIITISRAAADDIIDIFGISPDVIKVCYCGGSACSDSYSLGEDRKVGYHKADIGHINECLDFEEEFFLFISTIEPRKNVVSIIHAFEKYKKKSGSSTKLVLAGKRGWNCDDIYKVAENSTYKKDIVMPGYITDNEKEYLYCNAKLLLFPSIYEGFGIPVLEAMEHRLPVITSRVSSLPEVGGDAALYVEDPFNIDGILENIEKICSMSAEEAAELYKKMELQAKKFSWIETANGIMDLFLNRTQDN